MESPTQNSVLSHLESLPKPAWGPMGKMVYDRTYSRLKDNGEKETWAETVSRVVSTIDDPEEREQTAELIYTFKMVPAGRHLWVTGTGLPYNRNCFRAPFTDRLADHFEFMGSQLMTGGGVGANYSQEYLSLSPTFNKAGNIYLTIDRTHPDYEDVRRQSGDAWLEPEDFLDRVNDLYYNEGSVAFSKIRDSREGWVESWGFLFDHATSNLSEMDVFFDLTDVRPRGDVIKTFGGTASGPDPLAGSLVKLQDVIKRAEGRHLSSVEAMECDHYLAEAIVAGGARRSARMSIVHWDDPHVFDFIHCKENPMLHWSTNISVEVDDRFFEMYEAGDEGAHAVAKAVVRGMINNGEPGFYNSSLSAIGEKEDIRSTNPCGEITLEAGESCNIGSVNLAEVGKDDDLAIEAFRKMSRYLVRATLMTPDHNLTALVEAKNRRIGVGFFGFQEWAAAHGVKYSEIPNSVELAEKLQMYARVTRQAADEYADELGIPRPIKVTAIAPNGTISILPGAQAGIHPVLAKYFKRRVRFTKGDPLIDEAILQGKHVESCIYSQNTMVVENIVRDEILDHYDESLIQESTEITLDEQLAVLEFVTENFSSGSDGNAVSFTANIPSEELTNFEHVYEVIMGRLPRVKGMTIFPAATRPQSPIEAITSQEYHSYHGIVEDHGSSLDDSCSTGACPIK